MSNAISSLPQLLVDHIREQIGVVVEPCDYFTGVRQTGGLAYVNLMLRQRTSESRDFDAIERLCACSSMIERVEPNGPTRVAAFLKQEGGE